MMSMQRLLQHFLFWMIYLCITLFTELYLSSSFQRHPDFSLVLQASAVHGMLLLVKMAGTYYLLYSWIPRLLLSRNRVAQVLECLLIFALLLIVYRFIIHFIAWPLIYHEVPAQLNAGGNIARFFYSLIDLMEVAAVATAIKLYRLRMAAAKRERELIQEKLRAEIQQLKAQINPHFLFNSLNIIFALSRQQSTETESAVMRLSQILRFMLYESEKKLTTIGQELKIIEDFIALQEIRFGEKVKVIRTTDIDNPAGSIAPLLIFPLIENAFKHGVGPEGQVSEIHFTVKLNMGIIHVQVSNRIWQNSMRNENQEGIGLVNVKRQIELLYKDFQFQYEAKNEIFNVFLRIDTQSYAGAELFDH
jgi:two-component system, LytTR family, sensor kinase